MKTQELRTKSVDELKAFIAKQRSELAEKRRALQSGELANPHSINNIRRSVATALTIVKELESAAKEEK